MRLAVIGAGAAGSAAARFAARRGHQVRVFEQFAIDHDRGSSHGPSRIIRRTYPDPFYTALMAECYALWDELEREAATELRIRTGGIVFGPGDHAGVRDTIRALDAHGVSYDSLEKRDAAELFGAFRFRPDDCVIYQDDTGILRASDCVRAQVGIARAHGAEVMEGSRIRELRPIEGGVHVATDGGDGAAFDRAIVTAGPWTVRLLGDLGVPLTVTRQQQVFIRPAPRPGPSRFGLGRFPVWIDLAPELPGDSPFKAAYGFPLHSGAPGVKVALHQPGEAVDPDGVPPELDPAHVAALRGYLAGRIPDLGAGDVVAGKVCLYTNAPDHDFVLGPVPGLPAAYFASACSGHGFKFSVLVGKILVELAEGRAGDRDLSRFAPDRFTRTATTL